MTAFADAVDKVTSVKAAEIINVKICREEVRSGVAVRRINLLPLVEVKNARSSTGKCL